MAIVTALPAQPAPSPASPAPDDASHPAAVPGDSSGSRSETLQPATIHGWVRSREGAAYEGVRIELAQGTAPARSTTSDSAGQFSFTDVSPGPFTLLISSVGFVPQQIAGSVNPGQALEMPPAVLLMSNTSSEVRVSASQVEIAQEQLHEEEQQRALGIIPNFYVVYEPNAAPLTPAQKYHLAYRSLLDPVTFAGSAISAGIKQAENEPKGFGQDAQGYALRYATDYGDNLIGTFIGSALLPSLLHQDPRYFYKGTGTASSRFFYAVANTVICKSDKGKWQLNSSGLIGDLAGQSISQLYYPAEDRSTAGQFFGNFATGLASNAVQNVLQEFVVRHFMHHLPPSTVHSTN